MTTKKIDRIIEDLYHHLLDLHGPQGWWPLMSVNGVNPTKTGSIQGYHPGDYSYPKTETDRFEICIGAILTQNTNWPNVELALKNLYQLKAMSAKAIINMPIADLGEAIKPSGYFNQKAKKVKIFAEYYQALKKRTPTREELLALWGIGPETADSMLLYAYHQPSFVVDAYTKRIFGFIGFIDERTKYEEIKNLFESNLPRDVILYQEYHALIVEHAKNYYAKKPYGDICPLPQVVKQKTRKSRG